MLNKRVRRRIWNSLEELKKVVQDEWGKITMQEIRASISEMPERCKSLIETVEHPLRVHCGDVL
jgi:flagellar biosynthesis/type III secretory pathway chaperone